MSETSAAQRWEKVQALFEAVLVLPREVRSTHLEAAERDETLRSEVLSLLEHHEQEGLLDVIASRVGGLRNGEPSRGRGRRDPERIGPYEVVRTIARGGMGTIYLARHGPADQPVAVKLLRRDLASDGSRRRFLAEQQIVASLSHPSIARFLDDGVTIEGLPYFVMEFVEGAPIDEHCDTRRLAIDERLELFVAACSAVAHAHRYGLVHRDLKADNILVTADGRVKLLDFGIAKALRPDLFPAADHHTTKGVHLLTPEYASPEQLVGAPVTSASDVYQLGLLLYELLAGTLPPLAARMPAELLDEVAREPLEPPSRAHRSGMRSPHPRVRKDGDEAGAAAARGTTVRQLRRRLSGDLDAITMMALRERPEDRYASVERLRADLLRHLDGLALSDAAGR